MGWLQNMAARFAGRKIGKQLTEGPMEEKKAWFKSKTVWTGILTVVIAVYQSASPALAGSFGVHLPAIPQWLYAFLGAAGIYSRVTADTKIG